MRIMTPSEQKSGGSVNIETRNITFNAIDFQETHNTGYYLKAIPLENIPQDAVVICEHEIDYTQLTDADLNKDLFNRIYIDDTRNYLPEGLIFFLLGDEAIPNIKLTFRLTIFYK